MNQNCCMNIQVEKPQPVQVPGMSYVPMQVWQKLLPLQIGFYQGTIFQELNKPFQPKGRR